jgi:hypothetical protein
MSRTRVRSGRLTKIATLLMIALGAFSLLVNVTIAAIIIALGVAMYLFEWWMVRRFGRATSDSH